MGAEIWHSHEFFRMSSSIIAKRSPVWPPGLKWCSGMLSVLAACGLRFSTALPYINKMLNETFVAAYILICFTNVNRETKIGWVRPVCVFCKRANTQVLSSAYVENLLKKRHKAAVSTVKKQS